MIPNKLMGPIFFNGPTHTLTVTVVAVSCLTIGKQEEDGCFHLLPPQEIGKWVSTVLLQTSVDKPLTPSYQKIPPLRIFIQGMPPKLTVHSDEAEPILPCMYWR